METPDDKGTYKRVNGTVSRSGNRCCGKKAIRQALVSTAFLAIAFTMIGCGQTSSAQVQGLSAIQLFDRNGVQETISNRERTVNYEKNDFLSAQPYEKVVRTYEKTRDGSSQTKITTYHDNGQIWQYLETQNGRACGEYIEWHQNGAKRMHTKVIEGIGDLTLRAQSSWVFDGKSFVWDSDNNITAEINYAKGFLEDRSIYYHSNGAISKIIPYKNNHIEGTVQVYDHEGELIGRTDYNEGDRNGVSDFKGNEFVPRREELFRKGELISGKYWNLKSQLISEVEGGNGIRPIFENGKLLEEREYVKGAPEGQVKLYRENGTIESSYHVIDGRKEGEEWCYYDSNDSNKTLQPMLHINWREDEIHGTVRTWYEDGVLESEKEIIGNKKNGMLLTWYKDGSLMMVEEYENDSLVSGKYLKQGDDVPVSRVISGAGIVTIYDADGRFVRKVEYDEGSPKE